MIAMAKEQLTMAYAPYSGFYVAAALLCRDGSVYTGCNVENSSYPAGNCAERTAVFKAVSEGKREFSCIVIMGGNAGKVEAYCPPCGICRQVLREFCRPSEFFVILAKSEEDYRVFSLEELLPESFGPEFLTE
ncbi:MAG: cytidine deaminase [Lachnospiraceae bacterium]|nr:cytidine deaminase [Lachnospiraceae bacterium]